jgi:hypothetical protein
MIKVNTIAATTPAAVKSNIANAPFNPCTQKAAAKQKRNGKDTTNPTLDNFVSNIKLNI